MSLVPQFVKGSRNVVAGSLSRRNQVIGSEWTLTQEVVDDLLRRWPATIDMFVTSLNYRLPVYFSPIHDPMATATDSLFQPWNDMQTYAFPPFALVREVLNKVMRSRNLLTWVAPWWPQKEWFPDLQSLFIAPPVALSFHCNLLCQPHFHHHHLQPHRTICRS